MKTLSVALMASAMVFAVSCKNAEKKRAPAASETKEAPTAGKTAPSDLNTPAASPHGGAKANPHAKAPQAKTPIMQPSGAAALVKPTAADGTKVLGPFSIVVPKAWKEMPPTSGMRLAQWTIAGDKGPAEMTLYNFAGGGGGVDANINRWVGQFTQEDGTPSAKKAIRKDETIGGLPVTTLAISGRYVAAVRPGAPEKNNKANWGMLAAIISVNDTAYFFKGIGPKATMKAAEKDWNALVKSIKKL